MRARRQPPVFAVRSRPRFAASRLMVGSVVTSIVVVLATPAAALGAQTPTETTLEGPSTVGIFDPITFLALVRPSPDDGGVVSLVRHNSGIGENVAEDELTPNGAAHLALPNGLNVGTYTFHATFHGTESSASSSSDPLVVEVVDDRTPVTVTLESDGSPSLRGEPVALTVTVEPDPGTDATVQIVRADTSGIINLPVPIGPGGVTDVSWTPTATFDYPIKACFSGTNDFQADCSSQIVQSVYALSTLTTLDVIPDQVYQDEDVALSVSVDPPPELAVNARVGKSAFQGWFVGIDPDTGTGTVIVPASILRNELGLGHHQLIAFYPGSPNTDPSQSDATSLDIVRDASETSVEVDPVAIRSGESALVSVAVTPSPPEGMIVGVSIVDPAIEWRANIPVDAGGDGATTFDSTGWPDGTYPIDAVFGGTDRLTSSADSTSIIIDSVAPTGSLSIEDDAVFASGTEVTLDTSGTDEGSSLSQVALSNDGTTWTTRSYSPTQGWTLPSTNGTRTVYAKWKDDAGNWSSVTTDTIKLDTVKPLATAPGRSLPSATSISSGEVTTHLAWTGSDATSGIARFELAQRTDGGSWTTLATNLSSASTDRYLAPQHSYAFRVRAIDKAGNIGSWATGATFSLNRYSESNSRVGYSGTWRTVSSSVFWGGAAKKSSTAGSKASITFTGRSIAWVARTGPDRGKATIYVNGTAVATIDLYSSTYQSQRVVWTRNWSTASSRKVTIRVSGTSGRPRVDLDAFVTGS